MFKNFIEIFSNIFFIEEKEEEFFLRNLDKTQYYKEKINNFSLNKTLIACDYNKNLQKTLKNFKYKYNTKSLKKFIKLYLDLFDSLEIENKEDIIIIGIPFFIIESFFKNYNHTYILASELSKILDLNFLPLIKKKKYTKPQASLNREKRLKNLENCFEINKKFKSKIIGKTIILIDDVISTGTTSHEIGKVLKKAGAKEIIGLYLATGK